MLFKRKHFERRFGCVEAQRLAPEGGDIELSVLQIRALRKARQLARPGLGDLGAAGAHPNARAIDAAAGTKLAECGGCKKRREALNRIHL